MKCKCGAEINELCDQCQAEENRKKNWPEKCVGCGADIERLYDSNWCNKCIAEYMQSIKKRGEKTKYGKV